MPISTPYPDLAFTGCALVTGGSRGLGKAMALGLLSAGARVVVATHIDGDRSTFDAALEPCWRDRLHWCTTDLRDHGACASLVSAAEARFGFVDVLVNNAGLTMTTVLPDLYQRVPRPGFWDVESAIVKAVYDTNCVTPHWLSALVAPAMRRRQWGRIVNVTTMLETMERAAFTPYGPSKAALEAATVAWSRDLEGSGVTVNVLNPGGGANTPGLAQEMRDASARGEIQRLVEPEQMVAPLLWLASPAADTVTGRRFDASSWTPTSGTLRRAGFQLHADQPTNADPT